VSADNDYMAWSQLETQLPLLAWMALGEVDEFEVVLTKPSGTQARVVVPTLSRAGFEEVAAKRSPSFEPDWSAREARMSEGGVAYLRPGPFYDNRPEATTPWDTAAFRSFIDRSFESFIASDAHSVLIDLRDNPGGDNSFSDLMVAWFAGKPFRFSPAFDIRVSEAAIDSNRKRLESIGGDMDSTSAQLAAAYADKAPGSRVAFPIALVDPRPGKRFAGGVYVLVNRHSYSNTVLVAAIVQDYGFGRILGEETADLASTYGALEKFTLPDTGIEVSFPKARLLRPSGDTQARGVVPDVPIATPLTASTRDVVLEQALEIVRRESQAAPR
jgi:C-terminal processing protease CtpA/Prc